MCVFAAVTLLLFLPGDRKCRRRAGAAQDQRAVLIVTTTHVVCHETDREAEDYYQHYAVDHADSEALDYHMNMARRNRRVDTAQIFNERKRYAAGLGSHPLIGLSQIIAAELVRLQAAGIGGVTLSFVNFKDELPFFIERVLLLLRQAGLQGA